jgi:DNA modification methylase
VIVETIDISQVKSNPNNPRVIKDDKFEKLVRSIKEFPKMLEIRPIVVNDDMIVLGGNMRLKACKAAGLTHVPIIKASDLTEEEQRQFIIKDNVSGGEWDWDMLANEWDVEELQEWGLDVPNYGETELESNNKKLSERFIIPPFSVLDTKQGAWQERKNYWLSLGIKSEIGRDSMALNFSSNIKESNVVKGEGLNWSETTKDMVSKIAGKSDGVSIFDPVLCELSYQWFNIPNGNILDPFAGGSVRGIVAAKLGFQYLGNDLRTEQIEANKVNAKEVLKDYEIYPTWTCGDSLHIDTIAKDYKADMIFSCPPYADLEVYSDMKEDISNMPYQQFLSTYKEIIRKSCQMLKQDRFAVFVVGEVRDKKGFYYNFVSDTIMAFKECGAMLYNDMILLNSVGNAGMRASKTFNGGRKVVKVHQNVLVFYKGNPKNIKGNYPELDLSYILEQKED